MVPLESSKLFQELSPEELCSLRKVARDLKFAPHQTIFKEGDPGDGLYIVRKGRVQVSATVEHGQPLILTQLGPGELFGEMAVLDNDPRSATVTAQEPTIVSFIAREDLLAMLELAPRLATEMVREISRRLRDFNQQYIRQMIESERLGLMARFAGSIIHDLKNPLNVINLSAELAVVPNATPEIRQEAKERICRQVHHIANMVNELLEFTRGSQTPCRLQKVNYAKFINQVMLEIRPESAAKPFSIEVETPPAVTVRIDPHRLTRVFHNLITNATDAMPSGGTINLRFNMNETELTTELQDSGKGIAPEIQNRLFQPFATFGKPHGTGLGLSISKKIVEDHQGKIFARNAPSGGAIFGFTLALDQA